MDIVGFLTACLDADQARADAADAIDPAPWTADTDADAYMFDRRAHGTGLVRAADDEGLRDCEGANSLCMTKATAEHVAAWDPKRVLAEVAAKQAILAEVMSWPHQYVHGDSWLSCAQAIDPNDEDKHLGSGCADDKRAGGPCECSLDQRRAAILHPLAAPYANLPDYQERWKP